MSFKSLSSTTCWDYPMGQVGQDWWPSSPHTDEEPGTRVWTRVFLSTSCGSSAVALARETWVSRGQGLSEASLKGDAHHCGCNLQGQGQAHRGAEAGALGPGLGEGLDKVGTWIWGWGQGSFLGRVLGPRSRLQTSARACACSASFVGRR